MADVKGGVSVEGRLKRPKRVAQTVRVTWAAVVVAGIAAGCLHPRLPPLPIMQQYLKPEGRMEA